MAAWAKDSRKPPATLAERIRKADTLAAHYRSIGHDASAEAWANHATRLRARLGRV